MIYDGVVTKPELTEENMLMHWGVKGMKWRKRKGRKKLTAKDLPVLPSGIPLRPFGPFGTLYKTYETVRNIKVGVDEERKRAEKRKKEFERLRKKNATIQRFNEHMANKKFEQATLENRKAYSKAKKEMGWVDPDKKKRPKSRVKYVKQGTSTPKKKAKNLSEKGYSSSRS